MQETLLPHPITSSSAVPVVQADAVASVYERMCQINGYGTVSGFPLPDGYYAAAPNQFFKAIAREGFDDERSIKKQNGWKIHLTIHREDIQKAWDEVVIPLVVKHKVECLKFSTKAFQAAFGETGGLQAGKVITIYDAGTTTWAQLIKELEIGLAERGIRTSARQITGDRMIEGCLYTGYRNDRSFDSLIPSDVDGYISAEMVALLINDGVIEPNWAHNPTQQHDIFRDIDLSRDQDVLAARARGHAYRQNRGGANLGQESL